MSKECTHLETLEEIEKEDLPGLIEVLRRRRSINSWAETAPV